jgi:WD40 repeat protein
VDLAGKIVAELPGSPGDPITALAFDPDGRMLATADATGLIKVWRVRPDGGLEHQAVLPGHTGAVTSLSFTLGGRTLASGGVDRTVVLWDPLTGQERLTLTGHADQLVLVKFTHDGHSLWTVSRDGAVKRWRGEPRELRDPSPRMFPGSRRPIEPPPPKMPK